MTLQQQIDRQRVHYIVSSYQLDAADQAQFARCLGELLAIYPSAWIELALAEVLVVNWLIVPLPPGVEILRQVQNLLRQWQHEGIRCFLTPVEFQRITALDPSLVFQALSTSGITCP
jgi:hypothetical protein